MVIMKGCMQWNPVYAWKDYHLQQVLKLEPLLYFFGYKTGFFPKSNNYSPTCIKQAPKGNQNMLA